MDKKCKNYEDALLLLGQILISRRLKKLDIDNLSDREMGGITLLTLNIINIAEKCSPEEMSFYSSDMAADDEKDAKKSIDVYNSTKKQYSDLINLFELYLDNCDLKIFTDFMA